MQDHTGGATRIPPGRPGSSWKRLLSRSWRTGIRFGRGRKCAGQEFESFTASRRFEDFLWSSVRGCPDLLSSTESSLPPLESKMPGDPISKPPLCQANNCEFLENLRHHRSGECRNPLGLPSTSVETLDQIREHDAGYWKSGRDCDLERAPFDLIRDRTHQREADLAVICRGQSTMAGRRPARSWPACGASGIHTMSPRSGARRRRVTTSLYRQRLLYQPHRGDCAW